MGGSSNGLYYADYLQLEKLLDAQKPKSADADGLIHDENLFITVHQAYELWFKQQLFELQSVIELMDRDQLADDLLFVIVHRLRRIAEIQRLLNHQIRVMETMLPEDFLEFRDLLIPASGFQSLQFRLLEIRLGTKSSAICAGGPEKGRLNQADSDALIAAQSEPSLLKVVETWLQRLPLLETGSFSFWQFYQQAVSQMLDEEEAIILSNPTLEQSLRQQQVADLQQTREAFNALLDQVQFARLRERCQFEMAREALLAAIFINLYRSEPLFNLPHQLLQSLVDLDELLTQWRYQHALMVQRMLGSRIGTGGSSGHRYLKQSADKKRVFTDLANLATFLVKRSVLPPLPETLKRQMGFALSHRQE